jgi:hypothetical protein
LIVTNHFHEGKTVFRDGISTLTKSQLSGSDEVDHLCKVDPLLVADPDKIVDLELVADLGRGGLANMTPLGWG